MKFRNRFITLLEQDEIPANVPEDRAITASPDDEQAALAGTLD